MDSTTTPRAHGIREAGPAPERAGAALRLLSWIVIIACVLGGLELLVRGLGYGNRYNLELLDQITGGNRPDCIFLGTSQTRASIITGEFENRARTITGRPVLAVNFGIPSSRVIHHYLGLRNLCGKNPDAIKGSTVFVEMRYAMPEYQEWRDEWSNAETPQLTVVHTRISDLPALWRTRMSFERKLDQTVRILAKGSAFISDRGRMRRRMLMEATGCAESLLLLAGAAPKGQAAVADLTDAGGIRTDEAGVMIARQKAANAAPAASRRDWNNTVVHDLVELVRGHGGRVVFLDVPQSATMRELQNTAQTQQDAEYFAGVAREWETPLLFPKQPVTDADFPDLWHLGTATAKTYSWRVAESWARGI